MRRSSINIENLTFLIADANPFFGSLCQSILRSFGARKTVEVRNATDAIEALQAQKVSVLLCDVKLPPATGFDLVSRIRRNPAYDFRTVPILMMTNDPRVSVVSEARDCGANMVLAKPLSPSALFDRLTWVALNSRKFVDSPNYFGPDRRFKIEGFPNGVGRRKDDNVSVGEEVGPAMTQSDIDKLFGPSA